MTIVNIEAKLSGGATLAGAVTGIAEATANCSISVTLAGVGAMKNRNGRVSEPSAEHERIRRWFLEMGDREIVITEPEAVVRAALASAPLASGTMRLLRGIPHDAPPSGPGQMGPPPSPGGSGRYHRTGSIVLYLTDDANALQFEVAKDGNPNPIWVQCYQIPVGTMRIADFCQLPECHVINDLMFYAERATEKLPKPPHPVNDPTYAFSQRIADLVREQGFDGMIVRGCHGDYRNLVIFEPGMRWLEWTTGDPHVTGT